MKKIACLMILSLLTAAATISQSQEAGPAQNGRSKADAGVKFVTHRIGNFRSEAVGVGDFNGDGKPDIVAGPFLYLAPEFKPVKFREIKGAVDEKGKGYYWDFMDAAMDVDGDGRTDVVSCDWFQKDMWWNRNPGLPGAMWPDSVAVVTANHEAGMLADVDGDGKAREIVPHLTRTAWYEFLKTADGKVSATVHWVSDKVMTWGVGVGDLNGDGRPDFIRPEAWFEAPADLRRGVWKEHPLNLVIPQKPKVPTDLTVILVHDVNGDGLNDLIYSAAHGYGIYWAEQVRRGGEISFVPHKIDDSWTQAHTITLADLDGDGVQELVTGKRFMAHNGSDPEESAPPLVCYYKQVDKQGLTWRRYPISENEGIGAGMNIEAVDMDGDGDLDIVVTGKFGGPAWFENKTR